MAYPHADSEDQTILLTAPGHDLLLINAALTLDGGCA